MRISFIAVILFISIAGNGQLALVNRDAAHSDSAVLFLSYPNHVVVEGIDDLSKISMSAENAMLTLTSPGHFIVKNIKPGKVTLRLTKHSRKKAEIVLEKDFTLQDIGDTLVHFVRELDTLYSNGQTINKSRLVAYFSNPNFSGDFRVAHFKVTIENTSGEWVLKDSFVSGEYLGLKTLSIMNQLREGRLTFSDIVLRDGDNTYSQYKKVAVKF